MNLDNVFTSNYLKATDLGGKKISVTIADCKVEKMGDDEKPVVFFRGKQKGLVLNKTNYATLRGQWGPETEEWKGHEIYLYTVKTQNQAGQTVDGLRIEIPQEMADEGAEPDF
jgi:hypothetical protein